MRLDLNCDLGEGEPASKTRALMRQVTSANIACGGHAGDWTSMDRCARLAKTFKVNAGAHPGWWDTAARGRAAVRLRPEALPLLLLHQVGALEKVLRSHGLRLRHIKLHGALYHAAEADPLLARAYVAAVARWWPGTKIFSRAGGLVATIARKSGVTAWEEVFADRAYADDGTLVSRDVPGAVLSNLEIIRERARLLRDRRVITTVSGKLLRVRPQTLCIHSDTPDSVRIARAVREVFNLAK